MGIDIHDREIIALFDPIDESGSEVLLPLHGIEIYNTRSLAHRNHSQKVSQFSYLLVSYLTLELSYFISIEYPATCWGWKLTLIAV